VTASMLTASMLVNYADIVHIFVASIAMPQCASDCYRFRCEHESNTLLLALPANAI